ncbi:nucleolar protein 6 isoform X1 [Octopus bimaculoides]|uniref:Nucleolar protein 6 n=1 Tax=Octopus bimaculoides TaxID=37653 RepID=A0A0L8HCU0_OCTBM|nr:nucleolar protein 6 isoform X1 [Octopus bimaculoides]|eukprot:XP_014773515.1 PREDICTED: nucleolar protein 6-like isoform X1 [Octopus bimaculoides]
MTKRKYSATVVTESSKQNLEQVGSTKKICGDKNVIPPTAEEMKEYKEIENLQHSSLFRMQIKELLSEVKVSFAKRMKIEKSVQKLVDVLQNLPKGESYQLNDQEWVQKHGLSVPLVQKPSTVEGTFCFHPPSSVNIIGSFPLDTCLKLGLHVDIAVKIPKKFFDTRDFLNQRYIRKRALYLVALAAHLKNEAFVEELSFTYHHGDPYKPILIAVLRDAKDSCEVHIHPVTTYFKHSRFSHNKCNVRQAWFYSGTDVEVKDDDENLLLPTPYYNMSILKDLLITENQNLLKESLCVDSGQLKDGIILLKVWLHQRDLNTGYGAVSGFIISMYVAYLLKLKRLNKLMSSYQVFRTTLYNLANSDWVKDGISFYNHESQENAPTLDSFIEAFDVTFVDSTGFLNFTAALSSYTFLELQHEASMTLEILDSQNRDCFHTIFIQKIPFCMRYDQIFHITDMNALKELSTKPKFSQKNLDFGGSCVLAVLPNLMNFIHKILSKRVRHLQMKPIVTSKWSVNEEPPHNSLECLTFGLSSDEEHCYSIMEKGPPADHQDAKEFRELWSGKSELRKFKDGTICEAVIWLNKPTMYKKRMIFYEIISFMLNTYFSIPPEAIVFPATCIESILTLPKEASPEEDYGTGEEASIKVNQACDKLRKIISDIKITVDIKDIQGISPVFRFAEVFPALGCRDSPNCLSQKNRNIPSPDLCPHYCPVVTVLCMVGTQGQDPEDLETLYRLKALYLLELMKSLQKKFKLVISYHKQYLDILVDEIVFRLKLCFNPEIELLKEPHTSVEGEKVHSNESLCLWAETRVMPKLTSVLRGLGQQHQTYGLVVRLAKRWLAVHFLSDDIPAIAIELLVASLFLDPYPFEVPRGSICGFLRFLYLVSTFDWATSPFFVNLNNEYSGAEISQIKADFSVRTSFPPMTICIPLDKEVVSFWTREKPNQMMLNRLILIAKQSLCTLQEMLIWPASDLKKIFRPSLEPFDVVIHLKHDQEASPGQAIDSIGRRNYPAFLSNPSNLPVVDYRPKQLFMKDLRETFGHLALFYSDEYSSSVIGVLWRPKIFQPQGFKVSLVNGQCLFEESSKENQLVPNIEAIIEDMKILGNGIVEHIKVKTMSLLT